MFNSQCSILIRTERTSRNPTSTSAENCALGIEHWSDPDRAFCQVIFAQALRFWNDTKPTPAADSIDVEVGVLSTLYLQTSLTLCARMPQQMRRIRRGQRPTRG